MFAITTFAASSYRAKRAQLAQEWFSRGEAALAAGNADAAVLAFRTALAYGRDNRQYSLKLAQSLVSAGRMEEARSYVLSLAQDQPGDPMVNLLLARLEAKAGDYEAAVRYYRNAIYGMWEEDPERNRVATRLELAQYLLARNDIKDARAELIAASADLPRDPALRTRVGDMLLEAGDYADALKEFHAALELDRRHTDAIIGAGRAAYLMGDYANAVQYLRRAVQINAHDTQAAEMLRVSELVLTNDPYATRLSSAESARRARRDFEYAMERLQACAEQRGVAVGKNAPDSELQALYARALKLKPYVAALEHDPDLLDRTMGLVFDIEKTTAELCGEPKEFDTALQLIAREHGGGRQ